MKPKLKLFEDFINEEKQIASSGIITMYNLGIHDIQALNDLGASVTKDDVNSTVKDTTYEVKFDSKEVGEKIQDWLHEVEDGIPQEDIEALYPGLFEGETELHAALQDVGPDKPIFLTIAFGRDQISKVEKILDTLKAQKHVITYKREDKGANVEIHKYIIEFSSPYGIYLFGHMQGSNDGTKYKIFDK